MSPPLKEREDNRQVPITNVFAKTVIVVTVVCHSYDRRLAKADRLRHIRLRLGV